MKNILKIAVLLALLAHLQTNSQTWKERMDSTKFYVDKQNYKAALPFAEKALEIAKKETGSLDTNYQAIVQNLSIIYFNLSNYEKALYFAREDSSITQKLYGNEHEYFAYVLNTLARIYCSIADYPEAEKLAKKGLDMVKKISGENSIQYFEILINLSSIYLYWNRFQEGEPYFIQAMELGKINYGEKSLEYAGALQNQAFYLSHTGKLKEATALSEKVLEITKNIYGEKSAEYASSLNQLALMYKQLGNYDKADSMYREVIEIYKATLPENHYDFAGIYNDIAILCKTTGKFKEAEDYYKKALEVLKATVGEKHPDYARTINALSGTYFEMDRNVEAEEYYKKALEIQKEVFGENNTGYAITLTNLAAVYKRIGRMNEAEEMLGKAKEISEKTEGESGLFYLQILTHNAETKLLLGKLQEAEELIKKSISIYEKEYGLNYPNLLFPLNNLGELYNDIGRHEESEELFKRAISISIKNFGEENHNMIGSLISLSESYILEKKFDEAIEAILKAKEISIKNFGMDHSSTATCLSVLGGSYFKSNRYEEAEKCLNNAIAIFRNLNLEYSNSNIISMVNISKLYEATGRLDEAEKVLKKLQELVKTTYGEKSSNYKAILLYRGIIAGIYKDNYQEADEMFDKSIGVTIDEIQKNMSYMNEEQKIRYWIRKKDNFELYNLFITKYYTQKTGLEEKMLDLTLATKGIVLNSTQKALSKARHSRRLLNDWQNTRQFWLFLVQNPQKAKKIGVSVDSVAQAAETYERELSSQSADFRKAFDTSRVRWRDVQGKLNQNEAAIEIVRNQTFIQGRDSVFYCTMITKKDSKNPELVVLNNGKELENIYIKNYSKLIEKQRSGQKLNKADFQNLGLLYNQFWKPINEKLSGINKVYISMDGVYNEFNPNTLLNPETNKYILEELDLRIITSTRDLVKKNLPSARPTKEDNIAKLFGDPQFELNKEVNLPETDTSGLSQATRNYYLGGILEHIAQRGITPLPGTKVEIKKISEDFASKNWKVEDYTGNNALEENLKSAKNPKIIHIATHGVFLKDVEYLSEELEFENKKYIENPLLRSMLLFAGAENTIKGETSDNLDRDDGILTAYEAMNLDLDNTELVVLSACETGLGEVRNGDGVYGLQRAFQVAGAKSLIMSLWTVSDKATQELMTSFYDKWLSGKEKRAAFREAQMELKQKYPGFYYWGAFVMVGE